MWKDKKKTENYSKQNQGGKSGRKVAIMCTQNINKFVMKFYLNHYISIMV